MTDETKSNRREVLLAMGIGLTAAGLGSAGETSGTGIPYRVLGRTGEKVSCIGMGGFHLGKPSITESDPIKLIHSGVDRGINFLDNSWDYNNGDSEKRMGTALKQGDYRKRVFLMTKIDGRTQEAARKQIDESLKRLQTDRVDLLQFHEIIRFDDVDRIFSEGGAMEAFLPRRKLAKRGIIGFTGHKDPHIHLYMLEVADRHKFRIRYGANAAERHGRAFPQFRRAWYCLSWSSAISASSE